MAGLVPAIHVLLFCKKQDVDARDKRGHDGLGLATAELLTTVPLQHRGEINVP